MPGPVEARRFWLGAPAFPPREKEGGERPRGRMLFRPGKNLGPWAYAQRIVATRLLYRVHDPGPQSSRMQGICPRAR